MLVNILQILKILLVKIIMESILKKSLIHWWILLQKIFFGNNNMDVDILEEIFWLVIILENIYDDFLEFYLA